MMTPVSINPDDIVACGEIAERVTFTASGVRNWVGTHGFPEPVRRLSCGNLYLWSQVEEWLERTGRSDIIVPIPRCESCNTQLLKPARLCGLCQ